MLKDNGFVGQSVRESLARFESSQRLLEAFPRAAGNLIRSAFDVAAEITGTSTANGSGLLSNGTGPTDDPGVRAQVGAAIICNLIAELPSALTQDAASSPRHPDRPTDAMIQASPDSGVACIFCGSSASEVRVVAGPLAGVCERCVDLASRVLGRHD